jgi:hypothetical protein
LREFYFNVNHQCYILIDTEEETRQKKKNAFQKFLAPDERNKRKDCPEYVDLIRGFTHAYFRPDTHALKVIVRTENGIPEYHMPHIQTASIKDTHIAFLGSESYAEWQYQNRYIQHHPAVDGILMEDTEIFPTICLRLFYYSLCPCCKDPTQMDCADSMTVGFEQLLFGLQKVHTHFLSYLYVQIHIKI